MHSSLRSVLTSIILVALMMICTPTVHAQGINKTEPPLIFLGGGIGGNSPLGASGKVSLHMKAYQEFFIGLGAVRTGKLSPDNDDISATDFRFVVGAVDSPDDPRVLVTVGMAYTSFSNYREGEFLPSQPGLEELNVETAGVTVDFYWFALKSSRVALSANPFININDRTTFGGLAVQFHFGLLEL